MAELNLLKAQSQTILNSVNEIFQKGEFICPIEDEIDKNEELIGEFSNYEKAIMLASDKLAEETATEMEKLNIMDLHIFKSTCEAFAGLMWSSVKNRLGKKATEVDALGVRKNWQIVSINKKVPRIEIHCIRL